MRRTSPERGRPGRHRAVQLSRNFEAVVLVVRLIFHQLPQLVPDEPPGLPLHEAEPSRGPDRVAVGEIEAHQHSEAGLDQIYEMTSDLLVCQVAGAHVPEQLAPSGFEAGSTRCCSRPRRESCSRSNR